VLARITGMARSTISRGVKEIAEKRIPKAGDCAGVVVDGNRSGWRIRPCCSDLRHLVEGSNARRSMRPLLWTSKRSAPSGKRRCRDKEHTVCPHVIATACANWDMFTGEARRGK